jgi:hypothetical protein
VKGPGAARTVAFAALLASATALALGLLALRGERWS